MIETEPRTLPGEDGPVSHTDVEAWSRILASYRHRHPQHEVLLCYGEEELIQPLAVFYRYPKPSYGQFTVQVVAYDDDISNVRKLIRLLAEARGPKAQQFIPREVHRVLDLF